MGVKLFDVTAQQLAATRMTQKDAQRVRLPRE